MSAAVRPAAYLAALAAIFGGALAVGSAVGDGDPRPADHPAAGNGMAGMADAHGRHGAAKADAPATHGLGVAENGLRLVAPATARAGVRERFAFRVVDGHGATVRDFATEHTKRLHLIAVRRDLTGFQHLHPHQNADGAWSTDLELRDAGAYRVFADFRPTDGTATTLASDVLVGGTFTPRPLQAPATAVRVDGYDVSLRTEGATAGREATLTYTISRDGRPVAVEPYLGASGHLVALRAGDLAYLHVHPLEGGADAGRIAFAATYPSAGHYRLFVQFRHARRVHTAALTQEVATA
ncbi:MAG TPA: hypothetical protein VFY45_17835 [Baekduia sp.]|nr:hypothetical protein [Baekduia sp.]